MLNRPVFVSCNPLIGLGAYNVRVCDLGAYSLGVYRSICMLRISIDRQPTHWTGSLQSGSLQSVSLESRSTDFGSGLALAWESTFWDSAIWKSTVWNLNAQKPDFGSHSPLIGLGAYGLGVDNLGI